MNDKKKNSAQKFEFSARPKKKNSILIKKQQQHQKECVKQSIYIANVTRA